MKKTGDIEYEIFAHDFKETVEVPLGKFTDIAEAKRAIEKFDKEHFSIIFAPILDLYSTYFFEELEGSARVRVRRTDTGEFLRLG